MAPKKSAGTNCQILPANLSCPNVVRIDMAVVTTVV